MQLGFVTCHFPPDSIGGGQMQSQRLCKALSERYRVTVFTRSYVRNKQNKEYQGNYVLQRRKVLKIPVLKSVVDLLKVLAQIRVYKKDITIYICFHIQLASLMVILARFLYGTKAVVSPRGLEDFDFKWYKKGFQKFIYVNADLILIQSEKIREAFIASISQQLSQEKQEIVKGKIRIFPNGIKVPPRPLQKISERKNQVVFIGRLEPIKGIVDLIDAFRSCDKELHLLIIGDGSQRDYLESYSKGLSITFFGECSEDEINQHLKNTKALILPSLSENFPNVILEAFCAGVPVIGTDVGAIPELIEDGINGYIVPPSDPSILAEKINLILQDNERLDDMGRKAYQKVVEFDWQNLMHKFDLIIDV